MKVYAVITADYDLYGEEGFFLKKKDAQTLLKKLKKDPKYLWKKYLQIKEIDVKE